MTVRICASALLLACVSFWDGSALAQTSPVTFYAQNVPLVSAATQASAGGSTDFTRLRVMSEPLLGDVSFGVAYEQLLTLRQRRPIADSFVGVAPSGGEWLDLQWTIAEREHVRWQHRFDRLHVGWAPTDGFSVTAGRQTVSWATTLYLTPADPFAPFAPTDPFREYRAGVDALRLRAYPGPLTELEVVARPTRTPLGEEMTLLARGLTTWRGWELSGWGGALYGEPAGAFGATGSLFSTAVRGEVAVRSSGGTVVRGTLGVDRRFTLFRRDLLLAAEYQHDGFGGSGADHYAGVLASDAFRRGEMQVIGRDEGVLQASYQVHPLLSLATLWLVNLNDGSSLVAPSFVYGAGDEATIMGGLFVATGDDRAAPPGQTSSEYGQVGATGYLSIGLYF